MNDFDDLDELERELGPSLRVALRRVAAGVADQTRSEPQDERTATAIVDLGSTPAEQSRRRRWPIVVAAAAAVVIAVAGLVQVTGDRGAPTRVNAGRSHRATTVPTLPTSGSLHPGFDALMRSARATPSTPKTGELVASAWLGGDRGVYMLYADGRLIWLYDVPGTPSWVERRLTAEAVERVRSEFLSTGLFDPGQLRVDEPSSPCAPYWNVICVRDDGRLLSRIAGLWSPEEQLLVDHLGALPTSLPPTDWVDQQAKTYVPARYAVCLTDARPAGPQTPALDQSKAVKALPTRAAKLLGGRRAKLLPGLLGGANCFALATEEARAIAKEIADAFGAPLAANNLTEGTNAFDITANVDRPHLKSFAVQFWQLLPDRTLAFYYPATA